MTAPGAVDPALAPYLLSEQQKKLLLLGMGVLGGAAIGHAAVTHLFVTGMHEKERRNILVLAASGAVVYAVATLFGIDEKWWNVEATAAWAEEELLASQKTGPK